MRGSGVLARSLSIDPPARFCRKHISFKTDKRREGVEREKKEGGMEGMEEAREE